MGATIHQEERNLRVLRITGLLRKSELDAALEAEAKEWGPATRVRVLIIAEEFKGWERGADWGDTSFLFAHDDQIDKIAIVADPRWETETVIFAAAGIRRAPVKFFPPDQLALARAWLG
jgi:hypothetical protein